MIAAWQLVAAQVTGHHHPSDWRFAAGALFFLLVAEIMTAEEALRQRREVQANSTTISTTKPGVHHSGSGNIVLVADIDRISPELLTGASFVAGASTAAPGTGVEFSAGRRPFVLGNEGLRTPSQVFQDELTAAMTLAVEEAPSEQWIDRTYALIRSRAGTAEGALFGVEGRGLPLGDEVRAKVQWIRNDLMPKVCGGFFT